jgi:hypothetical protein
MSTTALDVVSVSGDGIREIHHPLLTATQLVAHPGTSPTVTVPVFGAARFGVAAVDEIRNQLAEPAEFFGVDLPPVVELAAVLDAFLAALPSPPPVTALTITVLEGAGRTRVVVTGTTSAWVCPDPVRLDRCDIETPLARADDPHWRRMAARTTSMADRDQLTRWLGGRGYVDAVSHRGPGAPFLGALLYERGGDVLGVENPEPTSVLTQLERCGAIDPVLRVADGPAADDAVWWVSPDYALHPVHTIGTTEHPRSDGAPTFARAA